MSIEIANRLVSLEARVQLLEKDLAQHKHAILELNDKNALLQQMLDNVALSSRPPLSLPEKRSGSRG